MTINEFRNLEHQHKIESIILDPKDTYFVEENGGNKTVKEILGIFRHENAPGRKIVAFVSYDDGTFEFVPTEVLAQIVHAAQVCFLLIIIIKCRNTSQQFWVP